MNLNYSDACNNPDLIFGTEFYKDKAKPLESAEHVSGARPSTEGKHQEGQARKGRDAGGGEKGDSNRRPQRKRPVGPDGKPVKGPWPPKKK
jgi:hypothetical protein